MCAQRSFHRTTHTPFSLAHHLPAVWPWAQFMTSLNLSLIISKTGLSFPHRALMGMKQSNIQEGCTQSQFSFSSVAQSCPSLCNPMNRSLPGLPVHHQLPELTQTHVHWVGDAIQPSHPLSSPSPPALSLSQNQGLFQWVSSLHHVAKVLEFQL